MVARKRPTWHAELQVSYMPIYLPVLAIVIVVLGLVGTQVSIIRKPILIVLPLLSASLIFVPDLAVGNRFLAFALTVAIAANSWRQLHQRLE
ncbi:MAG: hypothetical protein JWN95_998 [Frankiales bacterium]|nr:hypothetical protein [Frankiales bacterium]